MNLMYVMEMKFREYSRESSDEKSKFIEKNKFETRYWRDTLRQNEFI